MALESALPQRREYISRRREWQCKLHLTEATLSLGL
jgi:hypothetical protein